MTEEHKSTKRQRSPDEISSNNNRASSEMEYGSGEEEIGDSSSNTKTSSIADVSDREVEPPPKVDQNKGKQSKHDISAPDIRPDSSDEDSVRPHADENMAKGKARGEVERGGEGGSDESEDAGELVESDEPYDDDDDDEDYENEDYESKRANDNNSDEEDSDENAATISGPNRRPPLPMVDSPIVGGLSRGAGESASQPRVRPIRVTPTYDSPRIPPLGPGQYQQSNINLRAPRQFSQLLEPGPFAYPPVTRSPAGDFRGTTQAPFSHGPAPLDSRAWSRNLPLHRTAFVPREGAKENHKRRRRDAAATARESRRRSGERLVSSGQGGNAPGNPPFQPESSDQGIPGIRSLDPGFDLEGVRPRISRISATAASGGTATYRDNRARIRSLDTDLTIHWPHNTLHTSSPPQQPPSTSRSPSSSGSDDQPASQSAASDDAEESRQARPQAGPSPPIQVKLVIEGSLFEMTRGWSLDEAKSGRRLIKFERKQVGFTVTLTFCGITRKEYKKGMTVISCIWSWADMEYIITSVDMMQLLEMIINQKFTVEEKNRIRRNLEVCKPKTVSKNRPDTAAFFKKIMNYPPPRPRNIEKDVKVFNWNLLEPALQKIVSKYSAPPAPPSKKQT